MNQIIVPKKSTENDAYSNAFVVKAVNEALSYDWNNSSKKILLVIATNPISPVDNLEDMMKTINEKNIKMCFVNIIDKETKDTDSKLCVELKKGIKHPNFISKEVRTSKSLIETIKFVLSDNKKYYLATFQNDSLPVLILNELDDHDNYRIWDGQKVGFRQKSDIDESEQKIDPFMEKVLRSSYSRKCELSKMKRNADESAETIIKAHSLIDEQKQKVEQIKKEKEEEIEKIKKQKMKEKQKEIEEIKKQKDETEKKLEDISNKNYFLEDKAKKLDSKISEFKKQSSEKELLVSKLRGRLLEHGPAINLSTFPSVQDIIIQFDTLKAQYHFEASKLIKRSLKKICKDYSSKFYLLQSSRILFNILYKSYQTMENFEIEQKKVIANALSIDIKHKTSQVIISKNMRDNYQNMFNKIKDEKAKIILKECLTTKTRNLNEKLQDDALKKTLIYTTECLKICWEIILSCDPKLKIEPSTFKPPKETEIKFDDEIHEAAARSEESEKLNFVIWPAIVRADTNKQLSKIIGFFMDKKIQKWSNAKLSEMDEQEKKMQQEKKQQEKNEQEKAVNPTDDNANLKQENEAQNAKTASLEENEQEGQMKEKGMEKSDNKQKEPDKEANENKED